MRIIPVLVPALIVATSAAASAQQQRPGRPVPPRVLREIAADQQSTRKPARVQAPPAARAATPRTTQAARRP